MSKLRYLCWFAPLCTLVFADPRVPAKESLRYTISWPSGLSLGEAQSNATPRDDGNVRFDFSLDATLPGFPLAERAFSSATPGLCSLELTKDATRGKRSIHEVTTFDQAGGFATRRTDKGGESKVPIATCARDALTYIHHVRRELAQGRLPAPQTVWFGAPYEIRTSLAGSQRIRINDEWVDTDRLAFALKGPVANLQFEVSFARDPARTPVAVKVPLPAGTFTMELTR